MLLSTWFVLRLLKSVLIKLMEVGRWGQLGRHAKTVLSTNNVCCTHTLLPNGQLNDLLPHEEWRACL